MGYVNRLVAAAALALFALLIVAAPAPAQVPCGVLTPCPPPPAPPPTGGGSETVGGQTHTVTLNVDPLRFVDKSSEEEKIRFTGTYAIDGSPGSAPVSIVARKWPYTVDEVIHSGRTGRTDGTFDFSVTPEAANTEYYARVPVGPTGHAASPMQKVTVLPELAFFETNVIRDHVVFMEFLIDLPNDATFPFSGRKIHWYILRGKGKRTQLIQVARSRTTIRSRYEVTYGLRGKVRARLPRGRYKFRSAFCVDFPVGVDIGIGEPFEARCP